MSQQPLAHGWDIGRCLWVDGRHVSYTLHVAPQVIGRAVEPAVVQVLSDQLTSRLVAERVRLGGGVGWFKKIINQKHW